MIVEHGHGYSRDSEDDDTVHLAPEDEAIMHSLLSARCAARKAKQYAEADRIQAELGAAGVRVDDSVRKYRIENKINSAAPEHGFEYMSDGSSLVSEEDLAIINRLLLERVLAKRERNWAEADRLRGVLAEVGVQVDDRQRQWRVRERRERSQPGDDGTGQAPPRVFTRDPADSSGVVLSEADETTLHERIWARRMARQARNFTEADRLRDELKAAGVLLNDKEGTYSITTPSAVDATAPMSGTVSSKPTLEALVASGRDAMAAEHRYRRVENEDDAPSISETDGHALDRLLLERVLARRRKDWDEADRLRAVLREAGVVVDDRLSTYSVRLRHSVEAPSATAPAPFTRDASDVGSFELSAEDEAIIHALIDARREAKRARDFATADRCQEELKQHGVFLDDQVSRNAFRRRPTVSNPCSARTEKCAWRGKGARAAG